MKTVDPINIGVVTGYISDEGEKVEIHGLPTSQSNSAHMMGLVLLVVIAAGITFVVFTAPHWSAWLERLAAMR